MSKQPLTSGQIQEICEAIPINRSLPEHIRLSISSRIRTRLYNDLCRVEIYPQLFSVFKEELVNYYYRTLAPSGEAVGVQVAQSIGERQTQNTLNSIDWEDKIILTQNGECIVEPVGKFIDEFLEKEKEKVEYIEENRTQYLDLSSLSYDVKMPSVDENGHTEWLKVEALTRHLPVGKLVKVKTHFGREVTATQSKSFLVWDSSVEKFIDKNGSDLKVGDYLPTTSNLSRIGNERILSSQTLPSIFLDRDFGWIVGAYLSECGKDHLQGMVEKWANRTSISIITLYYTLQNIFHDIKKKVPLISYTANREFQYGLLEGFFSCDAVFNNDELSVLNNKDVIYGIGFILSYFGMFVKYEKDTETHDYRLIIKDIKNIEEFMKALTDDNKNNFVDDKKDVVFDQIVSIDYVEPTKEYVYDFTVEKTRNFIIFNGLGVRDTFHSSGLSIKTVVVGVPRFSELLNATRSPKMVNCLLYLNEPFDDVSHVRRRSGNMFTDMTIRRLLKSSELIKDDPLEDWHHLFCDLYEVNRGILGWRLRLHIDKDVLYEYQVTTKMIAQSIMNEYGDAIVLHAPDWVGIIDVFVDEGCFTKLEKEKEKVEKENAEEEEAEEEEDEEDEEDEDGDTEVGDVEDNGDEKEGDEKDDEVDSSELPIPIRKHDEGKKDVIPDDIDRVIHMEDKVLPSILDIRVCGVEGVKDIFFEKRKEEWIITTEGSNLYHLFAKPLIDKTRSMSNDMWEIYEIFGIEAARQFLIEEYMDIVSSDGTFVNASNVELLVDIMVYTGTIISISRYGQKKVGCGPMAKASFEESLENFLKAGVNGEKESANGVSASIMLGKMPNIGTGVFDLLVDIPKLLAMNIGKEKKDVKNDEKDEKEKKEKEKKNENTIPEIASKSIFQKF